MKFQALLISLIAIAASAAPLGGATGGDIEVDSAFGVVGIGKSLAWDKRELKNVAARTEEEDAIAVDSAFGVVGIGKSLAWDKRALVEDTVSVSETSGGAFTWEKKALVEDTVSVSETSGGAFTWEKRDGLDQDTV
ncbi:hypothetical protein MVEN_01406300 [Mycena venus]|uniref:Uncharacterized protein n=1 Tax=Mycena venus TaxID=2733690 RepID=A0A8H6XZ00_9AGAR|nr:hypothetical protein MVEN_01406300 [Mycena venus]